MKHSLIRYSILPPLVLLAAIAPAALAQPPGPLPGGEMADGSRLITKLNHALENVGAAELSESQEAAITQLVQEQWENRPAPELENSDSALHQDYEQAILSGDAEEAKRIAKDIAELMAARISEGMQAQVDFQIALLAVFTDTQLNLLQEELGDQGVVWILSGHGRMGPPGRPGGALRHSRGGG